MDTNSEAQQLEMFATVLLFDATLIKHISYAYKPSVGEFVIAALVAMAED